MSRETASPGVEGKLEDFADVIVGGTPSTKRPELWDGDIVWVTPTDVTGNDGPILSRSARTVSAAGVAVSSARLVPANSVLVTTRATIGPAVVAGCELATNQGVTALVPKPELDAWWLYYWVLGNRSEFVGRGAGNTFPEISRTKTRAIPITVPPIATQRRVASVFRGVDDCIQAGRQHALAADETRKALSRSLFGAQECEPRARLDDVVAMTSGSTPKSGDSRYWVGGAVPYLKSGELKDTWVDEPTCYVTDEAVADFRLRLYQPGTVLVAMYGATRGRVGRLAIPAAGNQAIAAMIPRDPSALSGDFLFFWLLHEQERLITAGFGGAQQNLSQAYLKTIELPLPPLAEQERVARVLDAASRVLSACTAELGALAQVRAALLSAVFAGEIGPMELPSVLEAVA